MKQPDESGMTIIEVIVAITILLIGVGFVLKGNGISYHYSALYEKRQQMIFYSSGIMEAVLDNQLDKIGTAGTSVADFVYTKEIQDVTGSDYLQTVKITVYSPANSDIPPLTTYTYRIKP